MIPLRHRMTHKYQSMSGSVRAAHVLFSGGIEMDRFVIMCRSISYAQRGERLLGRYNIGSYIVKVPQHISPEGCSYGLRVGEKNRDKALVILKNAGIRLGKVFRINSDGSYTEAGQ